MSSHKHFAAHGRSSNATDPWVIAEAMVAGAVVVTDEISNPNRRLTIPPKIPDVCNDLHVDWVSPIDFLALAGVKWERLE